MNPTGAAVMNFQFTPFSVAFLLVRATLNCLFLVSHFKLLFVKDIVFFAFNPFVYCSWPCPGCLRARNSSVIHFVVQVGKTGMRISFLDSSGLSMKWQKYENTTISCKYIGIAHPIIFHSQFCSLVFRNKF